MALSVPTKLVSTLAFHYGLSSYLSNLVNKFVLLSQYTAFPKPFELTSNVINNLKIIRKRS